MAFNWKQYLVIFPVGKTSRKQRQVMQGLLILFFGALLLSPRFRAGLFSLVTVPLHYKEYRHFGIRIPSGFSVHGIDVSRYQGRVDWARVRNMAVGDIRIRFAFIKASEGSWIKDPQFYHNWKHAGKQGLVRGAYHYFLPDISPADQLVNFSRMVRLRSGDLPPVVDIEESRGRSVDEVRRTTGIFLKQLEKKYGVKPIIYTNRDFYLRHFAGQEAFSGYPYWIAHFHVEALSMPGARKWHFWQHSDRGQVSGINEKVDFNVFSGTLDELRALCLP